MGNVICHTNTTVCTFSATVAYVDESDIPTEDEITEAVLSVDAVQTVLDADIETTVETIELGSSDDYTLSTYIDKWVDALSEESESEEQEQSHDDYSYDDYIPDDSSY